MASTTDSVTARLAALLGDTATQPVATELQTGRAPSGSLRNFRAMKDSKLLGVLADVRREANDPEALTALQALASERDL